MGSSRQLKRHATVKSSVVLLYADTPAWHLAFLVDIVQVQANFSESPRERMSVTDPTVELLGRHSARVWRRSEL